MKVAPQLPGKSLKLHCCAGMTTVVMKTVVM